MAKTCVTKPKCNYIMDFLEYCNRSATHVVHGRLFCAKHAKRMAKHTGKPAQKLEG